MRYRYGKHGIPLLLVSSLTVLTLTVATAYGGSGEAAGSAKRLYESRCVLCHGPRGDGKGKIGIVDRDSGSGRIWMIFPRDFTVGVFKFRTTPTGCLPTDGDLKRIIRDGVLRSGMPSHRDLSEGEVTDLVEYIKGLSPRWQEEEPCGAVIRAKRPDWVGSPESITRGKEIYKEMKCWECHGYEGRGDGPKSDRLKDDWGKPIWPFDFTTARLKRGTSPENVYLTFTTGLDGTGMPSYEDSLNEEERWHLVSYTLKLMGKVK